MKQKQQHFKSTLHMAPTSSLVLNDKCTLQQPS